MSTTEQENQFDTYGCAARCLMALANARGDRFTKADFIDKFAPKYWARGDNCGGLTVEQIKGLAKDLGLASDIHESSDFAVVRDHIRQKSLSGLLLYTKKRYEQNGTLSDYHHCTVVSPDTLQADDFLYLTELDYLAGTGRGLFLPESAIKPLIPTFFLFIP